MARIAFLTDRSPAEALLSAAVLGPLGHDVKVEPLGSDRTTDVTELAPSVVFVDCWLEPDRGLRALQDLRERGTAAPLVAVLTVGVIGLLPWHDVADEVILADASQEELRLRLELLRTRTGELGDAVLRLGPLAVNVETYQVTVAGRSLELTYKEFELLRFLVAHPDRVFTRSALLQEVWGYDFYGGTRTVDVHVRRLRAKLGTEHEQLIETIRGVGYRAAQPI